MARKNNWFDGFRLSENENNNNDGYYPGKSLGLPEFGAGSSAYGIRRVFAIFLDQIISALLMSLIFEGKSYLGFTVFLFWFFSGVITLVLFGVTPGQFFAKIRVVTIFDGRIIKGVTFLSAFKRAILISLIIPIIITDNDGRSLHDRLTDTVVVNS